MNSRLPYMLRLKCALVGTPFESVARKLRELAGYRQRRKHPELCMVHLEEQFMNRALPKLIRKQSNFLDVGCHIGSFLAQAVKLAPEGKHIAIEPSLEKSQWLMRRFPSVEVHAVAVSDIKGRQSFVEDTARPGYSHLSRNGELSDHQISYQVEVTTLDEVIAGRSVDVIKIDIEGEELKALRGGQTSIRRCRPSIIFECGTEYSELVHQDRPHLYDLLNTELNYSISTLPEFLFGKGDMSFDEFRRCGIYPFRAFTFVAIPRERIATE